LSKFDIAVAAIGGALILCGAMLYLGKTGVIGKPGHHLEKLGCQVYMPIEDIKDKDGKIRKVNRMDWNCLAGYSHVKRQIEDTVLLGLQHSGVYKAVCSATRQRLDHNKPRCVLFEGPPGCGKTTSARIISHQVNIPLVYVPL
jgi:SpoVK/Ycf46/Vps4 family AAA+-type ATPase